MAGSWAADPPERKGVWVRGRVGYWVGWFGYRNGEPSAEQELAEAAIRLDGLGDRRSVVDCLDLLGCIAVQRGDAAPAVRMFAVARRIREITGLVRHRYLDAHVA
ncbi:MAG: hypothetical protein L0K86_26505, partial [Actinomycetia bacterium]|nr:hypothetical protein [Actinomycetes bacterium]